MGIRSTRVVRVETRSDYSVHEVVELSGLPQSLLDRLVDCGALPASGASTPDKFAFESVVLATAARRLHEHFDLDDEGLAVAVLLLRRVRALEDALSRARADASRVD